MRGRRRLRLLVPPIVVVAMFTVATTSVVYRMTNPTDGAQGGYVTSTLGRDGLQVYPLPGADTKLLPGDRVVAVEGMDLEAWLLRGDARRPEIAAGDDLTYEVSRAGETVELRVPLTDYPVVAVLASAWGTLLFCVAMFVVGAYIYLRRPAEPGAAPTLVVGAAFLTSTVPWLLGFGALDLVTGSGFWLWFAGAFVVYSFVWSAGLHFLMVFPSPLRIVRHPLAVPALYVLPLVALALWLLIVTVAAGSALEALRSATTVQLVFVLAAHVSLLALLVLRYRSATELRTRQQLAWVGWGSGVAAVSGAVFWFLPELVLGDPLLPWSAIGVCGLPFPAAIAVAVLRHRLFDIDVVINRSLVYGGLTAAVVAIYAASAAVLGSLVRGEGSFAVSLLATGIAAIAALPIRDVMQRSVDRLMYGDRNEPYRAIARLGERLSASLTTEEVLPVVVATVASSLRLPYVAIELGEGDDARAAASTGDPGETALDRVPLMDRGDVIGYLVVASRGRGDDFTPRDRELLAALAHDAGRAARSVRLADEVERSRRELVAAREEERRRLRRDLHDGLGPTLAGARLKLQAATAMAGSRPADAAAVLSDLDGDLAGVLEDVRRISRGLRPPALDELGLLPALRAQAMRFAVGDALDVRVDGPADLPPLPAAVEAAAYSIALEAMTNARRHSAATRCSIRVRVGDGLEVEVEDDGRGIAPGTPRGVGLTAMHERAEEVGGTFEVGARDDGRGTRILARLPLALAGPA